MALRHYLPIFLLCSIEFTAFAQVAQDQWVMTVVVSGKPEGGICSGATKTQITASFMDVNYSNVDRLTFQVTSSHGAFEGILEATGSAECICRQPSDPDCGHTNSTNTSITIKRESEGIETCTEVPYNKTSGGFSLDVTVTYYKKLPAPTRISDSACGNFSVQFTSSESASTPTAYQWEIADNLFSSDWRVLTGKTTQIITVTLADINQPGFTGTQRFLRVNDINCSGNVSIHGDKGRLSGPSFPFSIFLPPASGADLQWNNPKCYGGDDGSLKINTITGHASSYDISLFYMDPTTGEHLIYQKLDVNSSPALLIDYDAIIARKLVHGIKAGAWKLKIENKTSGLGSCTHVIDKTIIQPTDLTLDARRTSNFNGFGIKCIGDSNGSATVTASGGTPGYTYSWTGGSTSSSISGVPAGDYKITVTDATGVCSKSTIVSLQPPSPFGFTIEKTNPACAGKATGKLNVSTTGGAPSHTYVWSTGDTGATADSLSAGITYGVTVTDVNGCTGSSSGSVTDPPAINFAIDEVVPIVCRGTATGSLEVKSVVNTTGTVGYRWGPDNENTLRISGKPSGTYTLTVTDSKGCSETKLKEIVDPPGHTVEINPLSNYAGSFIKCNGRSDGKLGAVVKDPGKNVVPAANYVWIKNDAPYRSGTTLSEIDLLNEATYKVIITYGANCKAENTYILSDPDPVTPLISHHSNYHGVPISCFGASDGSLKASGGGGTPPNYTYLWSNGRTGPIISGLPAGTYTVTATDANLCTGTATLAIEGPPLLKGSISVLTNYHGQAISCRDRSDAIIKAAGTGGVAPYRYSWNTGINKSDLINIGSGTYTVTIRDTNNCMVVTDTTLINPSAVVALVADSSNFHGYGVKCNTDNNGFIRATGSGGTGSYTFAWANSTNTNALHSNLVGGTYRFTVTDTNGCPATNTVLVTKPPVLTLSLLDSTKVSCFQGANGTITVHPGGGAQGYEYSRDAGLHWQESPTISGLNANTHTIIVRDDNGCQRSVSKKLLQPARLSISFSDIEPAFCEDPRGAVTANVSGGVGNYRYLWTDLKNDSVGSAARLSNRMAGVYKLLAHDGNDCPVENSIGITSTDGAKVKVNSTIPTKCSYSADGSALLEIIEGDGPFTYLWPDGQATIEGAQLTKGDYIVSITDNHDCTVVQPVTITGPEALDAEVVSFSAPTCYADCDGKLKVSAAGGVGAYTYLWGSFSGEEVSNICAGNHIVNITDDNGCMLNKTFLLTQPDSLQVNLLSNQMPVCHDGCDGKLSIVALGGNGNYNYNWSNNQTTATSNNLCAGSYSVIVSDAKNCRATGTYVVDNPPVNNIDLGGSVTLCVGQTKMLDAGPQWTTYKWGSNTGFESTEQRIVIQSPGQYWVDVFSNKGCTASDTFLLETSLDLLKARFAMPTQAIAGDTIVMIDISWPLPESISWTYPEAMRKISDLGDIVYGQFDDAGTYEVRINVRLGECRDAMTKSIVILEGEAVEEGGRLGHQEFVKEFTLYPNPNDGSFDVSVELLEESPITISIWSTVTSRSIGRIMDNGKTSYLKHIDLRPLSSGTYVLRLDHEKGYKLIRFIVH